MAVWEQSKSRAVSYYEILGVSPHASDEEIKKSYRKLAMQCHPDHNQQYKKVAEMRFRLINEAYSHLKSREKRTRYNHMLRSAHPKMFMNDNGHTQPAQSHKPEKPSWLYHIADIFRTDKPNAT